MKKLQFIISILITTFICSTLTACGFRPRSARDIPPPLRTIYLDTPNPYSQLTVQLRRTLQAVDVHVTKTAQAAPVTLRIINSRWSYYIPTILYSGNATKYSYTLTVTFALETRNGKVAVGPKTLGYTRTLLQNANQVYTPNATRLMKREITHTMVTLIYDFLISNNTSQALNKALAHEHARHPSTKRTNKKD